MIALQRAEGARNAAGWLDNPRGYSKDEIIRSCVRTFDKHIDDAFIPTHVDGWSLEDQQAHLKKHHLTIQRTTGALDYLLRMKHSGPLNLVLSSLSRTIGRGESLTEAPSREQLDHIIARLKTDNPSKADVTRFYHPDGRVTVGNETFVEGDSAIRPYRLRALIPAEEEAGPSGSASDVALPPAVHVTSSDPHDAVERQYEFLPFIDTADDWRKCMHGFEHAFTPLPSADRAAEIARLRAEIESRHDRVASAAFGEQFGRAPRVALRAGAPSNDDHFTDRISFRTRLSQAARLATPAQRTEACLQLCDDAGRIESERTRSSIYGMLAEHTPPGAEAAVHEKLRLLTVSIESPELRADVYEKLAHHLPPGPAGDEAREDLESAAFFAELTLADMSLTTKLQAIFARHAGV